MKVGISFFQLLVNIDILTSSQIIYLAVLGLCCKLSIFSLCCGMWDLLFAVCGIFSCSICDLVP